MPKRNTDVVLRVRVEMIPETFGDLKLGRLFMFAVAGEEVQTEFDTLQIYVKRNVLDAFRLMDGDYHLVDIPEERLIRRVGLIPVDDSHDIGGEG